MNAREQEELSRAQESVAYLRRRLQEVSKERDTLWRWLKDMERRFMACEQRSAEVLGLEDELEWYERLPESELREECGPMVWKLSFLEAARERLKAGNP